MNKQLLLVQQFHQKYHSPVLPRPTLIAQDRYELRHRLMHEEVQEYLQSVQQDDLHNTAKELADIMYALLGTILEHGLQDHFTDIFEEVHRSNMTKSIHQYKMIKGTDYQKADIRGLFSQK